MVDRIATMFDYEQVFTDSERLLREKFELPVLSLRVPRSAIWCLIAGTF